MIYPWHAATWATLYAERQRRHHALLVHGAVGIGKRCFAEAIAHSLLCSALKPEGLACGQCNACRWLAIGAHPDFLLLTPDADRDGQIAEAPMGEIGEENARGEKKLSTQITVEKIRELQHHLSLTTHAAGGKRVVLIQPAESLNVNAANALLKMLEEPPASTLFLLVADQPRRLLPTILSRCRRFPLPLPNAAEALAWLREQGVAEPERLLAQAGGAPITAMAYADTSEQEERRAFLDSLVRLDDQFRLEGPGAALDLAARSQKTALPTLLRWLSTWAYDLLASRLLGGPRYHLDYRDTIATLSTRLALDEMLRYQDVLKAAVRSLTHPLNPRLLLEQLLLSYSQILTSPSNPRNARTI